MYRSVSWWDLFHNSFVKALGSFQDSQINGRICNKLFPERWIYRKAGGSFFSIWRTELQTAQLEPFLFGFLLFNWWQSVLITDKDSSPIQHKRLSRDPRTLRKLPHFPSLNSSFFIGVQAHKYEKVPPQTDRDEEKYLSERSTFHFCFWKYCWPLLRIPKIRRVIT